MAGRSRGKVCRGRKELGEWEHTGKGSGSRCIWVPGLPNGFLQQTISSGLGTLSVCWWFLTAFWFHHHKGVKREFRIIRFVLNILRTTNRYVQRLIAKKTLTVRKGAAYKPRWREASKPPETWVVVGKILLGSPHLACCHSLGVTRFLYVMWRRKPACRSHVRRQGRYLELTQTTPEILP